jgi:hypothetical protein
MTQVMESFVRPLSQTERRLLAGALTHRQRRMKSFSKRQLIVALVIFGALWGWTMIATNTRWYVVAAIWVGIGGVISLWLYFSEKPKEEARMRPYEDALRRNEASVIRIRSDELVELEKEDDQGTCYAFQLTDDRIVFVSGQDFYPSVRFPNSDFSLVHIYGENGVLVERFIEKHGKKLEPARRISAQLKSKMMVPDHLQVLEGK